MMRSGRNPDRIGPCSAVLVAESSIDAFAREFIDVERDLDVEAVPIDDAVREDFPLFDALLYRQAAEVGDLVGEVVDADTVDAGVESSDRESFDDHAISEGFDDVVA